MQLIDMRETVSNIVCEWFFHCCPLVGYEKGLNGSLEPEPGSNGGGRGSEESREYESKEIVNVKNNYM